MKLVRVILADDDNLVRAGIRSLLENLPDIEVVGEESDGQSALSLCEAMQPDVVFLDISMPRLNGLEVAARVHKICPQTHIVMLSMYTNAKYVHRALRAGAVGYLPKHASMSELEIVIQTVRQGDIYISPTIPEEVMATYFENRDELPARLETLTERQREILQLIAEGHTTGQIADILAISPKTVETHRAHLMSRLKIYEVAGLVRFAVQSGLVILNMDSE